MPFDEQVEGVSHFWDKSYAFESQVQTDDFEKNAFLGSVKSRTDPVYPMSNWGPELVESARGKLLLGNPNEHSHAIDWPEVRNADPEFLIIAPSGYNLKRAIEEIPVMENYPGWHELRSVREGKVIFADGNLYFNRSGITVMDTAEMIADIIHGTSYYTPPDNVAYWQAYPMQNINRSSCQ